MNKSYTNLFLILTVSVVFILPLAVHADVPNIVNYQGRLTDDSGAAVSDGIYLVTFSIYCGSPPLQSWTSGEQSVLVLGGLLNYQLGSMVEIPEGLFGNSSECWLGIKVGIDAEISPRTRLTSVPYAYKAMASDTAEFALNADKLDGVDASTLEESNEILIAVDSLSQTISQAPFENIFHFSGIVADGSVTVHTVPSGKTLYLTGVYASRTAVDTLVSRLDVDGTAFLIINSDQGAGNWCSCGGAPIPLPSGSFISFFGIGTVSFIITGYEF